MFFYETKSGYTILIVVLVMSVLSLCCLGFWHSTALRQDMSFEILAHEQKLQVAKCGLDCGVAFCKKNFDKLIEAHKKNKDIFSIKTDMQKLSENLACYCNINIRSNNNSLHVESILCNSQDKELLAINCDVFQLIKGQSKNKTYYVQNWSLSVK